MLRSTQIYLDYNNLRRDRRYAAPPVCLIVGDGAYGALNWSLGGILLDRPPAFSIGARFAAELRLSDSSERFEVVVEVLRRDLPRGTLACRFIEPSHAMVGALDAAVAARSFRRSAARRAGVGAAIAAGLIVAAPQAFAGPAAGGSDALVPGGFPLPEFRLNFPDLLDEPVASGPSDLQISLTSPDKRVLHFLFSPRSQFAMVTDPGTGTSRSSMGLSWNLFHNDGFFGSFGVAGSVTHSGVDDVYRRYFGPPLALHGTFEFGYRLGAQHMLTLSLDHASAPDMFGVHGELDNFQLRYGLKF